MQLRKSNKNDIPALKKMWKDIFKDSDSYIELYFNNNFKEDLTFVITEDDKIVSMLFCEKHNIICNKEELEAIYICGVATKENMRNKGYSSMLINTVLEEYKDIPFIFLIPATDRLFKFYEKFGFKVASFIEKEEIKRKDKYNNYNITKDFCYEKINNQYENSGNFLYVKRNEKDYISFLDIYKFIFFDDGYMAYYIEDNILNVMEYSYPYPETLNRVNYILNKKNLNKAFIYKKWCGKPFSMYKGNEIKTEKSYINLMLN